MALTQQRISFLNLPAEIRNQIYTEYFASHNDEYEDYVGWEECYEDNFEKFFKSNSISLLGTCKTVRNEARLMRVFHSQHYMVSNWQTLYALIADQRDKLGDRVGQIHPNEKHFGALVVDLSKLDSERDIDDMLKILSRSRARTALFPCRIILRVAEDDVEWMASYAESMIKDGIYAYVYEVAIGVRRSKEAVTKYASAKEDNSWGYLADVNRGLDRALKSRNRQRNSGWSYSDIQESWAWYDVLGRWLLKFYFA